jgi:four helix bundle protein
MMYIASCWQVSSRGIFPLRDQIRRACISVMSNITEGFERNGRGKFLQFLSVAKGSVGEAKAQLYIVSDQGYVDKETFEGLIAVCNQVGRMIGGLMEYLRQSKIKGAKYR